MPETKGGTIESPTSDSSKSARLGGWERLNLEVSPELARALRELAKDGNKTVEEVLAEAVTLYSFASRARREGKHVGVAASEQDLDVEITGF